AGRVVGAGVFERDAVFTGGAGGNLEGPGAVVVGAVPPAEGAIGLFHLDRGSIGAAVGGEKADGAVVEGLDDLGLIQGKLLGSGGVAFEIGEYVGHFASGYITFDAFGHEGLAAAFDLFQLAAGERDLFAFGADERQASAGFFGEDARELSA